MKYTIRKYKDKFAVYQGKSLYCGFYDTREEAEIKKRKLELGEDNNALFETVTTSLKLF